MKRIRWWLGKCLIFTANCRDLEGLAKLRYLWLKDTWKACVRSDCNLSTSLFHACTPPSTTGGLLSLPSQFPSGKERCLSKTTHPCSHQAYFPPVTNNSAWGGRLELLEVLTLRIITEDKGWHYQKAIGKPCARCLGPLGSALEQFGTSVLHLTGVILGKGLS